MVELKSLSGLSLRVEPKGDSNSVISLQKGSPMALLDNASDKKVVWHLGKEYHQGTLPIPFLTGYHKILETITSLDKVYLEEHIMPLPVVLDIECRSVQIKAYKYPTDCYMVAVTFPKKIHPGMSRQGISGGWVVERMVFSKEEIKDAYEELIRKEIFLSKVDPTVTCTHFRIRKHISVTCTNISKELCIWGKYLYEYPGEFSKNGDYVFKPPKGNFSWAVRQHLRCSETPTKVDGWTCYEYSNGVVGVQDDCCIIDTKKENFYDV